LDWHKAKTGITSFVGAEDPGVISVTQIYKYFKEKGFKTEVMGASFRNLDEIKELAGCDLLTIAPKFLEELKKEKGDLVRKLDVSTQINNSINYEFEEKDFRLSMLEDQMASEKLSEGITGFSKAIEELEELLLKRYSEIKNQKLISTN
jgi:transaldolase